MIHLLEGFPTFFDSINKVGAMSYLMRWVVLCLLINLQKSRKVSVSKDYNVHVNCTATYAGEHYSYNFFIQLLMIKDQISSYNSM